MEPASGLSTYCRGCGGYIRLGPATGGGNGRGLSGLLALAKGKQTPAPPQKTAAAPRPPEVPLHLNGYGEKDAPLVARANFLTGQRPSAATKDPPRRIDCFECDATHKVAVASTSTICPGCSTYIDLRNLEVKDRTNQRIRTRGDVVVEKRGALLGTSIHCGNLTIHGTASGSIYASGEVHLRADARIIGEIRCRRFILDKKCEVHCLQPVRAEIVEIHGRATGHFHASQRIVLSRHASLTGSATAPAISVAPGAVLNGEVLVQAPGTSRNGGRAPVSALPAGLMPSPA